MKLNNYIIVSLLSHILFFGLFIAFYREISTDIAPRVFDVDIIGPIRENLPKPPLYRRKVPPKSVFHDTKPEILLGEGVEPKSQEYKNENAMSSDSSPDGSNSTIRDSDKIFSDKDGVLPEGEKGLFLKPKSFLFDKETIEKYARKKTIKGKEKSKGLTFDIPELHHRGYMRNLKDKIESVWQYPEEAARRGVSGDLHIMFSIQRNGSLGEVRLVRTSGYTDLDKAAMKALKDAAPFWPLPDDLEEDKLSITGHFIYILGEAYIM